MSLAGLITEIDDQRGGLGNLSSSLRLYVLRYLKGTAALTGNDIPEDAERAEKARA